MKILSCTDSNTNKYNQSFDGKLVLKKIVKDTEHSGLYTVEDYHYIYHPYIGEKPDEFFTELVKYASDADESGEIYRHFKLGKPIPCKGHDYTAKNLEQLKRFGIFSVDIDKTGRTFLQHLEAKLLGKIKQFKI